MEIIAEVDESKLSPHPGGKPKIEPKIDPPKSNPPKNEINLLEEPVTDSNILNHVETFMQCDNPEITLACMMDPVFCEHVAPKVGFVWSMKCMASKINGPEHDHLKSHYVTHLARARRGVCGDEQKALHLDVSDMKNPKVCQKNIFIDLGRDTTHCDAVVFPICVAWLSNHACAEYLKSNSTMLNRFLSNWSHRKFTEPKGAHAAALVFALVV